MYMRIQTYIGDLDDNRSLQWSIFPGFACEAPGDEKGLMGYSNFLYCHIFTYDILSANFEASNTPPPSINEGIKHMPWNRTKRTGNSEMYSPHWILEKCIHLIETFSKKCIHLIES